LKDSGWVSTRFASFRGEERKGGGAGKGGYQGQQKDVKVKVQNGTYDRTLRQGVTKKGKRGRKSLGKGKRGQGGKKKVMIAVFRRPYFRLTHLFCWGCTEGPKGAMYWVGNRGGEAGWGLEKTTGGVAFSDFGHRPRKDVLIFCEDRKKKKGPAMGGGGGGGGGGKKREGSFISIQSVINPILGWFELKQGRKEKGQREGQAVGGRENQPVWA